MRCSQTSRVVGRGTEDLADEAVLMPIRSEAGLQQRPATSSEEGQSRCANAETAAMLVSADVDLLLYWHLAIVRARGGVSRILG